MSARGVEAAIDGVELSYGERRVLSDVDLVLDAGSLACLVGPNGAGKSSLLRCLAGVLEPQRGGVVIDGTPVRELDRSSRARRVAVVPALIDLPFATRVEEMVGLGRIPYRHPFGGLTEPDRRQVDWAIGRVGIGHLRERDLHELSMGERQLVLLAMALAQGGGLLLLDEPTVHLDLRHQVEVLTLLAELSVRDGLTVLAVLHDLPMAAHFFPRLVLLHDGRVVADGPPRDVLTPERIRTVYGVDPRFLPALHGTLEGTPGGYAQPQARFWGGS